MSFNETPTYWQQLSNRRQTETGLGRPNDVGLRVNQKKDGQTDEMENWGPNGDGPFCVRCTKTHGRSDNAGRESELEKQ